MIDRRLCNVSACALFLVVCALAGVAPAAHAADRPTVEIAMMTSTSLTDSLPFDLFRGKAWHADPDAQYVKLHMHLAAPVDVTHVRVTLCHPVTDQINWFANFDEIKGSYDAAGMMDTTDFAPAKDPRDQDRLVPHSNTDLWFLIVREDREMIPVGVGTNLHSFTINFGKNRGVCVSDVRFYEEHAAIAAAETQHLANLKKQHLDMGIGDDVVPYSADMQAIMTAAHPLPVHAPRAVSGTVSATTIQSPQQSYDPALLFDSRYEFGWISDSAKAPKTGDVLTFTFDQLQRIEKLRIWNGYQRSPRHCITNARVKTLVVEGDGGYHTELPVRDVMGSQDLTLPTPYEGKEVKLRISQTVMGVDPQDTDTAISELRFYDGKDWFLIDPLPALHGIAQANRTKFHDASLDGALDRELVPDSATLEKLGLESFTLRLRSDGSMYYDARTLPAVRCAAKDKVDGKCPETTEAQATVYSALGNYDVRANQSGAVQLRLFGMYRQGNISIPDCNGCGWDCNDPTVRAGNPNGRIFQEDVQLARDGSGFILINAKPRFLKGTRVALVSP
jgi:hypothetical protein